jgi:hypothetical protein
VGSLPWPLSRAECGAGAGHHPEARTDRRRYDEGCPSCWLRGPSLPAKLIRFLLATAALLHLACVSNGVLDAGAPDSGQIDAGQPDSGCTALLCMESSFVKGRIALANGVIWGGARGLTVLIASWSEYPYITWQDGENWPVQQLSFSALDPLGAAGVASLSGDDYFLWSSDSSVHFVNGLAVQYGGPACSAMRTVAVSNGDVWFGSLSGRLCLWRPDSGFEAVPTPSPGRSWSAIVGTSDGGILLGDVSGDVVQLGSPPVVTPVFSAPITSLTRFEDHIWATSEPGDGGTEVLAWFRPDAGWQQIDTGPTNHGLSSLWVSSANDIWATGLGGVVHFDGESWQPVTAIPGSHPTAQFTLVSGNQDRLVLGGWLNDGGTFFTQQAFAIVLRRR